MPKIAVIDIETTGLNPIYDLILEIGIVELDLLTGEKNILFDSCVREPDFGEFHKESWIFLNSDMSFEEIQMSPLLENVRERLQTIFNTFQITAFNKSFDLGFLKNRGFTFPRELPCIMRTATNICKIPFPNGVHLYDYGNREHKWPKVQEAWDFFFPKIDYAEQHRAADDAIHEAMIFYEMYKQRLFII